MKSNMVVLGVMVVGLCNCGGGGPKTSDTAEPEPVESCKTNFSLCPPAIYNFRCWNEGPNKNYHVIGGIAQQPDWYNGCAYVDPAVGWETEAKDACVARCKNISEEGYVCKQENWSGVDEEPGPQTCTAPDTLNMLVVEQELGTLAANDASALSCDLWEDCFDFFSLEVQDALSTPPTPTVRYTADTLLETVPSASSVTVLGNAQTAPTTRALTGEAAYTAPLCGVGEVACPIYLAQLDLSAASAFSATIAVPGAGTVTKTFSDVEIHLKQPTLGIWLPNFEYAIFPPDSLVFTVTGSVSGTEVAGENGSYLEEHIVRGYVFGTLDGGLTFSAEGEHSLVDFSVHAEFAP
ncbi:hypothetical protein SAMN02745121_01289 [Nannocystis exedens]|uniref:Uncharacterized protein n=1 Tax=Nannocystis exedens TaxID=54 RepID=A0A1I1V140_9BACT|nr:hypothetical protein [Nannocystis exedens]PCC72080.1 hypothetical protein NAEX_05159 [Nannocystis exedens]SFD73990.1 hypothetical protein SAMN02745121_01289 [Nannocystis exedens]